MKQSGMETEILVYDRGTETEYISYLFPNYFYQSQDLTISMLLKEEPNGIETPKTLLLLHLLEESILLVLFKIKKVSEN